MTGTRWRWSMSSSIMFLVLLVGLWMPWIMATGTEVSTTATEKKQQGAAVVVEKEKSREDIVGERAKRRQQFAQQVEQLEKEQIENNKRQLRVDKKSKMDPQDQERLIQLEAFQRKMESLSRPLDDRRVDRLLSREAKWNEVHENVSHKKQQQQQQRRAALSPNQDHHKNHQND